MKINLITNMLKADNKNKLKADCSKLTADNYKK